MSQFHRARLEQKTETFVYAGQEGADAEHNTSWEMSERHIKEGTEWGREGKRDAKGVVYLAQF